MKTVQLIHWNDAEAKKRAGRVKRAGYDVSSELPRGPQFLRVVVRKVGLASGLVDYKIGAIDAT